MQKVGIPSEVEDHSFSFDIRNIIFGQDSLKLFINVVIMNTKSRKAGIRMLVVTTENIKGYKVKEVKGQAFGVLVRSRGLGGNVIWRVKKCADAIL